MLKFAGLWFLLAVLIAMSGLSSVGVFSELACATHPTSDVVRKTPGASFTAEIAFRNTGETEGSWSVNAALECESWTWKGTSQSLTLRPGGKKTLSWNGTIPTDAQIDSTARLIVYYGNTQLALNWWINVIQAAELSVTGSILR